MRSRWVRGFLCGLVLVGGIRAESARGQAAQKGIGEQVRGLRKLRVDYVGYRAARCEAEAVVEPRNERPNKGGLIHVYLTNTSKKPVRLAFYRCNGKDASHWLLGAFLAWDRIYDRNLSPGEMTVLELNAVTDDFAEGRPFSFTYIDRTWKPACYHQTRLAEDKVRISLIRVLPGMDTLEVHVRHTGSQDVELASLQIIGQATKQVEWVGRRMAGPGHAISRIRLDKPLAPSSLIITKLGVQTKGKVRFVYSHRRAFEDWFPIGCWSAKPETYDVLRRSHIRLVVKGGRADDEFYTSVVGKYGFRTMVPAGEFRGLDTIRSLADHPAVACWMLADEPDWSTPAIVMKHLDGFVRSNNSTRPTFITLCRNVKFFEYASIADIPCMDHYCVTAPTSSKWPHPYGTRLEETGYYTRDLKAASEPKPIWVWTQGIANWDERPKRPVPTPRELASQLLFNIGRGAKGIIWFNYSHSMAKRFPDALEAMRGWGRVMRVVRGDLLAAEPISAEVRAPDKVDAAVLASWDKLVVCVNNLDYKIHPEAYPFTMKRDVEVSARLPGWIKPASALLIAPDGVTTVPFAVKKERVTLSVGDLDACKLIVLSNSTDTQRAYKKAYAEALKDE